MTTYVLNAKNPESREFTFRGDLCVCAEGSGTFRLLREMDNKFVAVTDSHGQPLEYGAVEGVAFNSHFSCNVSCRYKISATGDLTVTIKTEK
tara:strand:+ start:167 stop:442 length:276 start_codon:yes stop_codon:yes gene_type:complete